VINNYIRFMENGPRAMVVWISRFNSHDQEDIERVQRELKDRSHLKAVIWNRIHPFEHLSEVGQMGGASAA
jgi:hypothetical protein